MKGYFKNYIKENLKSIIVLLFFVLLGIISGVVIYQFLDNGIKNEIINTMKSTLDITKGEEFKGINVIKNGIISNVIFTFIIYLTSVTLISPYLVSLIILIKGLAIGIYMPTLFNIFTMPNSILTCSLLIILPNLLYIPSYVYMGVNSIKFNRNLMSGKNKIGLAITEIIRFLIGFSIIFLGVIFEQLASGFVISIYSNI